MSLINANQLFLQSDENLIWKDIVEEIHSICTIPETSITLSELFHAVIARFDVNKRKGMVSFDALKKRVTTFRFDNLAAKIDAYKEKKVLNEGRIRAKLQQAMLLSEYEECCVFADELLTQEQELDEEPSIDYGSLVQHPYFDPITLLNAGTLQFDEIIHYLKNNLTEGEKFFLDNYNLFIEKGFYKHVDSIAIVSKILSNKENSQFIDCIKIICPSLKILKEQLKSEFLQFIECILEASMNKNITSTSRVDCDRVWWIEQILDFICECSESACANEKTFKRCAQLLAYLLNSQTTIIEQKCKEKFIDTVVSYIQGSKKNNLERLESIRALITEVFAKLKLQPYFLKIVQEISLEKELSSECFNFVKVMIKRGLTKEIKDYIPLVASIIYANIDQLSICSEPASIIIFDRDQNQVSLERAIAELKLYCRFLPFKGKPLLYIPYAYQVFLQWNKIFGMWSRDERIVQEFNLFADEFVKSGNILILPIRGLIKKFGVAGINLGSIQEINLDGFSLTNGKELRGEEGRKQLKEFLETYRSIITLSGSEEVDIFVLNALRKTLLQVNNKKNLKNIIEISDDVDFVLSDFIISAINKQIFDESKMKGHSREKKIEVLEQSLKLIMHLLQSYILPVNTIGVSNTIPPQMFVFAIRGYLLLMKAYGDKRFECQTNFSYEFVDFLRTYMNSITQLKNELFNLTKSLVECGVRETKNNRYLSENILKFLIELLSFHIKDEFFNHSNSLTLLDELFFLNKKIVFEYKNVAETSSTLFNRLLEFAIGQNLYKEHPILLLQHQFLIKKTQEPEEKKSKQDLEDGLSLKALDEVIDKLLSFKTPRGLKKACSILKNLDSVLLKTGLVKVMGCHEKILEGIIKSDNRDYKGLFCLLKAIQYNYRTLTSLEDFNESSFDYQFVNNLVVEIIDQLKDGLEDSNQLIFNQLFWKLTKVMTELSPSLLAINQGNPFFSQVNELTNILGEIRKTYDTNEYRVFIPKSLDKLYTLILAPFKKEADYTCYSHPAQKSFSDAFSRFIKLLHLYSESETIQFKNFKKFKQKNFYSWLVFISQNQPSIRDDLKKLEVVFAKYEKEESFPFKGITEDVVKKI